MTAKLTRQQEIQNAQIAVGKGMRYILAQLKADSTCDYFTEGPFPAHGGTWKTDAPSPGQQRLIAALREYDRDGNPLNIVTGVRALFPEIERNLPPSMSMTSGRGLNFSSPSR